MTIIKKLAEKTAVIGLALTALPRHTYAGDNEVRASYWMIRPLSTAPAQSLEDYTQINVYAGIATRDNSYDARGPPKEGSAVEYPELEYFVDVGVKTKRGIDVPVLGYNLDIWMTPEATLNDPRDDMRINPEAQQASKQFNAPTYLRNLASQGSEIEIWQKDSRIFEQMREQGYHDGAFVIYTQGTVFVATAEGPKAVRIPGLEAGTGHYSMAKVTITGIDITNLQRYPYAVTQWVNSPLVVTAGRHKLFGTPGKKELELTSGSAYGIFDDSTFAIVGTRGLDEIPLCNPSENNNCRDTMGLLYETYQLIVGKPEIRRSRNPDFRAVNSTLPATTVGPGDRIEVAAPYDGDHVTNMRVSGVPITVRYDFEKRTRRSTIMPAGKQEEFVVGDMSIFVTTPDSEGHLASNHFELVRVLCYDEPVDEDGNGTIDSVIKHVLAEQSFEVYIAPRPPFQFGAFFLGYTAGLGTGLLTGLPAPSGYTNTTYQPPTGTNNNGSGAWSGGGDNLE